MLSNRVFNCFNRCQMRSQFKRWFSIGYGHTTNVSACHADRNKGNYSQTDANLCRQRRNYSFIHDTSYLYYGNDVQTDVALFEMFKNQETGLLSIGQFLSAVRATGLRKNDPRLQNMMENLKQISRSPDGNTIDTQKLTLDQFKWFTRKEKSKIFGELQVLFLNFHTLELTVSDYCIKDFLKWNILLFTLKGKLMHFQYNMITALNRYIYQNLKSSLIVQPNVGLLSYAFRHQFIIPEFEKFSKDIEEIYWKCKENTNGTVASYIPQLKRMSPNYWGVSIVTIDGQRYSIGDVNIPFTIQSCSKPLSYGIALDTLGADVVHKYVGQEPSGRNFNELILDHNKKPHNPMINAGAIIICSLLKTMYCPEMSSAEIFDFTMGFFEKLAGNEDLGFNNAVFLSERECADRNYALGFYMKEHKCFPDNSKFRECMDFYFQCCSLEANCDLVAVMAATLANGGICPLSEEKVLKPESVRDVLSLMHSCGMYDYSGQFAFKVGLPAKSGVSGAMLVVVPNVMGMCLYSPPLDALGNSCRGVQFCEELVKKFNFHRYDNLRHASNKSDPRKHKFETKGLNIVNLLFSAASGDLQGLRRHKLSGMDMTLSDYDGRTALHLAASEGHLSCVEFLLKYCQVPYSTKDRWGRTPVDEAVAYGHTEIQEMLRRWHSEVMKKSTQQEDAELEDVPVPEFSESDKSR